MKIAILADPLDNQTAGVHTYVKELIKALLQHDHDNQYLLIREKKDPAMPLQQIAVPNIRLPIGFASIRLFFIIPIIARLHRVDAVLEPAHFGPFNLPKRIKRITVIHDLTPLLFPQYHRFHSQILQKLFLKGILKKTDLILTNSQHTTKDVIQFFPFTKSKVSTILLGRDPEFQPVESREFLNQQNISNDYFLFTGTIEPRKNLPVLLKAYGLFRDQVKEKVQLVITGKEGWKTTEFHKVLGQHPYRQDIILTGFIEKQSLIELYSHALSLIYPSLYEGFGLPVLEAFSCETKVICSDRSSLPEVGGDVAYYFNPEKEEDLLDQMLAVYAASEKSSEKNPALLKQAENFSWDTYAKEFMNAIDKLNK